MAPIRWRTLDDALALPDFIRAANDQLRRLAQVLAVEVGAVAGAKAFPNGATQPTVAGAKVWEAKNTVATVITTFRDGTPGQEAIVWASTANTTIQHSAAAGGIRTTSGANIVMTATEVRRFVTLDGISWREA
jgi:hypothetical protein